MSGDRLVVAAVIAALVAGCSGEPVCVRNSDCAAPLTCTASGVCGDEYADAATVDAVAATDATEIDAMDAGAIDAIDATDAVDATDASATDAIDAVVATDAIALDAVVATDAGIISNETVGSPGPGIPPIVNDFFPDARQAADHPIEPPIVNDRVTP